MIHVTLLNFRKLHWRVKVVGNTKLLNTITRHYRAQEDDHWYLLCDWLVVYLILAGYISRSTWAYDQLFEKLQ